MLSPCLPCNQWSCVLGERKKDCLTNYPTLRSIANAPGGFGECNEDPANWPEYERKFYLAQLERNKNMGRGRPAKPTQAQQLLEALAFVGVATRDDNDYQKFVRLHGKSAVTFNGQLSAGHPIAEELTLCPHLDKLEAALKRCGKSLVISETPSAQLSIKGDKLRALVPCMAAQDLPAAEPDPIVATVGNVIKEAFKVCGVLASEAGERVIEASLLLEANVCTGTNGAAIVQYWHGLNLPPEMVLPKVFTAAVVKQAKDITGFGFSWGDDGKVRSVTFHFDGGGWIRTQCYQDRWPALAPILDVAAHPAATPAGLFDAVEAVGEFSEDQWVTFGENAVMSHDDTGVGAQYEVQGLQAGKKFKAKLVKLVAPYAKTIDLTTYQDRAFFFGGEDANPVRGAIIGASTLVTMREPVSTIGAAQLDGVDDPGDNSEAEADQSQGWGQG